MSTIETLLQKQYGNLHDVIPPLVSELGQVGASIKLGVRQNWLSRWMKRNGYVKGVQYVRLTDKARVELEGVQP